MTTSVIVGGSSGIGRVIAERAAARGDDVVITSRAKARAEKVAAEIGPKVRGRALDLGQPDTIAASLADVRSVDHLVLTAIEQHATSVKNFDAVAAVRVLTIKLVGYTETVRALLPRFQPGAAVVLFGGLAKDLPYPGSTMVTTFNGGISGLTRTLAVEIAPFRVNALHPAVVGDSPKWRDIPNHPAKPRTPLGRLVTMDEVADAAEFLLRNGGVNGIDLYVDGGIRST